MADFEVVGRFTTLALAQVAQSALESVGISSFFENAEIVNADWLLGNAVGDVRLLVAQADVATAREILAESHRQRRLREADERDGTLVDHCLACLAVFPANLDVCPECGWSYAPEAASD